jgi:hypothetical protein
MATDSASTTTGPQERATPAPQPLWPAPVFVLGVAALVAVWLCRPLWPTSPLRRIEQDLSAVAGMLERPDGDVERALKLAQRCL